MSAVGGNLHQQNVVRGSFYFFLGDTLFSVNDGACTYTEYSVHNINWCSGVELVLDCWFDGLKAYGVQIHHLIIITEYRAFYHSTTPYSSYSCCIRLSNSNFCKILILDNAYFN